MSKSTWDDRPVHDDFRLLERDGVPSTAVAGEAPRGSFVAARDALRAAWTPPRDTYVTEDLPVLLTRLNLERRDENDVETG